MLMSYRVSDRDGPGPGLLLPQTQVETQAGASHQPDVREQLRGGEGGAEGAGGGEGPSRGEERRREGGGGEEMRELRTCFADPIFQFPPHPLFSTIDCIELNLDTCIFELFLSGFFPSFSGPPKMEVGATHPKLKAAKCNHLFCSQFCFSCTMERLHLPFYSSPMISSDKLI